MKRLALFLISSILVALAPGPDNCFVLAQSAGFGASAGLWVTAGLISGLCVHITLAVLGVATLLERFPRIADGVIVFGAIYLLTVAWGMWGAGIDPEAGASLAAAAPPSALAHYLRGVVLNLSNPKVILFFVAFLPKFLPTPCTHRAANLMTLGVLFALSAFTVMATIALLGGTLAHHLRTTPQAAHWVGRSAALAVAAIALWMLRPYLRHLSQRVRIVL